jgi:hypothetical protein
MVKVAGRMDPTYAAISVALKMKPTRGNGEATGGKANPTYERSMRRLCEGSRMVTHRNVAARTKAVV